MNRDLLSKTQSALIHFVQWLEVYGELSQDHQDFYGSRFGRMAKALYSKNRALGTVGVAPMVFCEAFIPSARRLFFRPMRLPIADAHYAMGFALLFRASKREEYLVKAIHFLDVLNDTRCDRYKNACWGYPFDWQTKNGVIVKGTPLVTTTPYCYEAFDSLYRIENRVEWRDTLHSIAQHVLEDYKDYVLSDRAATCSYTPLGGEGVVNASAYRSLVLMCAAQEFGDERYTAVAKKNIQFVLQSQNADGSWPYSIDGARDFIDHFHTCFVLKALAKIEKIAPSPECRLAIDRGVRYYINNLFDEKGLPKPFSKPPRLTVYKHELYDYAECLNLCFLLRNDYQELNTTLETVLSDLLQNWVRQNGSFRSRKLLIGYDNVPMHRWGQSEIFRSLSLIISGEGGLNW